MLKDYILLYLICYSCYCVNNVILIGNFFVPPLRGAVQKKITFLSRIEKRESCKADDFEIKKIYFVGQILAVFFGRAPLIVPHYNGETARYNYILDKASIKKIIFIAWTFPKSSETPPRRSSSIVILHMQSTCNGETV